MKILVFGVSLLALVAFAIADAPEASAAPLGVSAAALVRLRRERDAHGGGDGDREVGVEAGLMLLVVSPHVTDGVDRGHDPKKASHQSEQHAEWLDLERDRQTRQSAKQHDRRLLARVELEGRDGDRPARPRAPD